MSAVLLDTHVVQWWSAEPHRLSARAREEIEAADELLVAAITWFELAWLADRGRIVLSIPLGSWLERLGTLLRALPLTPAIAARAVTLPQGFPGDPADRLIYATALEHGLRLVTKDRRLRDHPSPRPIALW